MTGLVISGRGKSGSRYIRRRVKPQLESNSQQLTLNGFPHLHIVHAHDVPTVVHVLFEVFVLQDGMSRLDRKWLNLHLKSTSPSQIIKKH